MTLLEFAKENRPELLEQWHPEKNGSLTPCNVTYKSHKSVWWRCEHGHEWQALVKSRTRGTGCPVCTNRTILPGVNDLATTHPDLAAQWHPERNGKLKPSGFVGGSEQAVWWRCEAGHEWSARIHSRVVGNGCPVCAGKMVLAGVNDLASKFPDVAESWHPEKNGDLRPEQVTPNSNKRVWWQCELGHEWSAIISTRASRGLGCPFCAGKKVLAGFNDLKTRHPDIAAEWHPFLNEDLTPEMVTPGANRQVWWQCQEGHVWKARLDSRTGPQKTGCPVCAGKVKQAKRRYYDELEQELRAQKQGDSMCRQRPDAICV